MQTKRPSRIPSEQGLLLARDVAARYRERTGKIVSEDQVRNLAKRGLLPIAFRDGRGRYFSLRAVDLLVSRGTTRSDWEP